MCSNKPKIGQIRRTGIVVESYISLYGQQGMVESGCPTAELILLVAAGLYACSPVVSSSYHTIATVPSDFEI
jgi:hypothetical protein